jgi:hypothetical protein
VGRSRWPLTTGISENGTPLVVADRLMGTNGNDPTGGGS